MTQSGQGEEPSAQPAREGIVLPSDGGEPVLPGGSGGPGGIAAPQPGGPLPSAPPPGGQAWDRPWGPEQPPVQDQGWLSPPPAEPWSAQAPQQQPYQQQQHEHRQHQQPQQDQWGRQDHAPAHGGGPGPLPPEGAPAPSSYDRPAGGYDPYAPHGTAGQDPYPPIPGASIPGQGHAAPLPPAEDRATHYLPPVRADRAPRQPQAPGADDGATQYLPPVAAAPDEGATQYIPPVGPGALPPEMPPAHGPGPQTPAETTQYLGRARQDAPGPGPDADATQYVPPVTGQPYGDRQPPAEFDNLFRSGPGGPAPETQQLPRFQDPQPAQPSYDTPGPARGRRGGGGRTGSRVPVIAACGVAIALVGIGAGALLGAGGDDNDDPRPVSATAPADESASASASPSPSVDPARTQAVELDKLLADSGDSRAAVINAVNDVKACTNLAEAAEDLRDAAAQRNDLVTRLSGLTVDELPQNAELTAALTKAWQASAAADNHYAAWADQVAAQKGKLCRKNQARATGRTQAGNRESGTATTQKSEAAKLWNPIAKRYGLTERRPTQL